MATVMNLSVVRRIVVVALGLQAVLPSTVSAEQPRVYVGGALNLVTRTRPDADPERLGGTVRGGSVVFGVQVSPRVSVEFEPSFGEPFSWEYRYRPSPTLTANVVASRRDSFFSFQVRTRVGALEPVVGLSYLHAKVGRHATLTGGAPDSPLSEDSTPPSGSLRTSTSSRRSGCWREADGLPKARPEIRSAMTPARDSSHFATARACG
jgi:hypothetical protein